VGDLPGSIVAQAANAGVVVGIDGITVSTVQFSAEVAGPPFRGDDPGTELPGWIVAHMLAVATLEIRDPMLFRVLVVSGDASVHGENLATTDLGYGWSRSTGY
jgi:hypothetical protein